MDLCDYLGGRYDDSAGVCRVNLSKYQIESAPGEAGMGAIRKIRLTEHPLIELVGSIVGISSTGYTVQVTEIRPRKIYLSVDVPP